MKTNIRLQLAIPGATPQEIDRGLTAAHASLQASGVAPWDAAYGQWMIEGEDMVESTDKHASDATAWDDATDAAIEACCAGWAQKPTGQVLELLWDE